MAMSGQEIIKPSMIPYFELTLVFTSGLAFYHLCCEMSTVEPDQHQDYQGVVIFQVILYHLGTQLSVWIMQVSSLAGFTATIKQLRKPVGARLLPR